MKPSISWISIILGILFLTSCAQKLTFSDQKSFEQEDAMILAYIQAISAQDHKNASRLLDDLFKRSRKAEYLIAKAQLLTFDMGNPQEALKLLDPYLKSYPHNPELLTMAYKASVTAKDHDKALEISLLQLQIQKTEQSYIQVANAYILKERYQDAITYLESGYLMGKNEEILLKMTTLMYLYKNQQSKALSYLESHIRLHDFSEDIGRKLIGIYRENNNIDGLISVVKKLNERYPKKEYKDILIQLYVLRNNKKDLVSFLKKYEIDIKTFMVLYRYLDRKSDRYKIAMEQFKKTGDVDFLAQAAMIEYEMSLEPKSQYTIDGVIKKFEQVLQTEQKADYLNYLGYILIKHDKDLKNGMGYVREALRQDPNSPYYLDSLAWGYYKLKRYEKAYAIMQKAIKKLDKQDHEISFHLEQIKKKLKISQ